MTTSQPAANPLGDVAQFFATSGWTIQAEVSAECPNQADVSGTGPQSVFTTRFSSAINTGSVVFSIFLEENGAELFSEDAIELLVEVSSGG